MEHIYPLVGVVVVYTVGALLIAAACVAVFVLAVTYLPRFNFGAPKNYCEFRASTEHDGPPFNRYRMKWWIGISHRPGPRWFFGLMRWEDSRD